MLIGFAPIGLTAVQVKSEHARPACLALSTVKLAATSANAVAVMSAAPRRPSGGVRMGSSITGLRRRVPLATLSRVLLIAAGVLLPQSARAAFFSLDYSTLTELPSATGQGLQYVTAQGYYGGWTESQGFQVQPGLLHIVAPSGYFLDKGAGYQLANGYDHTLDVEYKFTARVTSGTLSALQFTFGDSTYSGGFGIGPGSFYIPGVGNSITLRDAGGQAIDPTQYHTYDYVSLAGTGKFTLTIDGDLAYSGNLGGGGATSYAFFGNPVDFNSSGYVTGDIASITYSNSALSAPVATPEPTSLTLVVLGAGTLGLSRAWRRG
jgi:hypothetical protein